MDARGCLLATLGLRNIIGRKQYVFERRRSCTDLGVFRGSSMTRFLGTARIIPDAAWIGESTFLKTQPQECEKGVLLSRFGSVVRAFASPTNWNF